MVHSAILPFGIPENGINTYLSPFFDAIGSAGTLAAPTFTFSFLTSNNYDFEHTKSVGMGAFAEAVRKHPDSTRTRHPLQSVAVIGDQSRYLGNHESRSAYSAASAMQAIVDLDFKIVLLGAQPGHISLSHLIEERAQVPYRYTKKVSGTARFSDHEPTRTGLWHFYARYLDFPIVPANEDVIVGELAARGEWHHTRVNGVTISCGRARRFCRVLDEKLAEDPYWMLSNADDVKRYCAEKLL